MEIIFLNVVVVVVDVNDLINDKIQMNRILHRVHLGDWEKQGGQWEKKGGRTMGKKKGVCGKTGKKGRKKWENMKIPTSPRIL